MDELLLLAFNAMFLLFLMPPSSYFLAEKVALLVSSLNLQMRLQLHKHSIS